MPSFQKSPGLRAPFGPNEYLRSTKGNKFDSATVAAASVVAETIDGGSLKVLQRGELIARITDGPYAGYYGPFQAAGTAEVQTITKTGTWSAGYYSLTILGIETVDIPYNATAAAVQALVDATFEAEDEVTGQFVISGGPLSTTPLVVTFHSTVGGNVAASSVDVDNTNGEEAGVTGSTPGVGVVETTAGTAGATDGRGDTANIVGFSDTFLPWELNERDADISVAYEAAVKQSWCFERNASGVRIPLSNTTRDAILALPGLAILFK